MHRKPLQKQQEQLKGTCHWSMFVSNPLTCSGVAVMLLATWGAGVTAVGLGEGIEATAAGGVEAKYLIMAGSTSGVPWRTNILQYCSATLDKYVCILCISFLSPFVACGWETMHPGLPWGTRRLSSSAPHKCGPHQLNQGYF